ncbi:MAG: hypothetical protein IJO47_07415 [Clostridia bacterium]|nr:hypothetical protein [Clostridia bacterium]
MKKGIILAVSLALIIAVALIFSPKAEEISLYDGIISLIDHDISFDGGKVMIFSVDSGEYESISLSKTQVDDILSAFKGAPLKNKADIDKAPTQTIQFTFKSDGHDIITVLIPNEHTIYAETVPNENTDFKSEAFYTDVSLTELIYSVIK